MLLIEQGVHLGATIKQYIYKFETNFNAISGEPVFEQFGTLITFRGR